jgi:hypothetical protein
MEYEHWENSREAHNDGKSFIFLVLSWWPQLFYLFLLLLFHLLLFCLLKKEIGWSSYSSCMLRRWEMRRMVSGPSLHFPLTTSLSSHFFFSLLPLTFHISNSKLCVRCVLYVCISISYMYCTSLRVSGVCMHWCTIVWYDCDVKRRSGCPYGAKQEANRPNKKNVYNAIHPDTQTDTHTNQLRKI